MDYLFQNLRHTNDSSLAMRGTHIRLLKDLLSHKDLAITQRDFHPAPENLKNARKKLITAAS
jgi:site-specific recombinase XerD